MDKIPSATPRIRTATSVAESGRDAALRAAEVLRQAIAERGSARAIFASAPSQQQMLIELATAPGIDWTRVTSFHMDEYLGLSPEHPNGFGLWLRNHLPDAAMAGFERIDATGRPVAEATRYSALVAEEPIDLVCLGIGVNGHIAFNEPGLSGPEDPEIARIVTLDDASRQQQVHERLFDCLDHVPTQALTLTIPTLLSGRSLVCSVSGSHKAEAVARAAHGPIDDSCPASFLRTHPDVEWFLDTAAAALLDTAPDASDASLPL